MMQKAIFLGLIALLLVSQLNAASAPDFTYSDNVDDVMHFDSTGIAFNYYQVGDFRNDVDIVSITSALGNGVTNSTITIGLQAAPSLTDNHSSMYCIINKETATTNFTFWYMFGYDESDSIMTGNYFYTYVWGTEYTDMAFGNEEGVMPIVNGNNFIISIPSDVINNTLDLTASDITVWFWYMIEQSSTHVEWFIDYFPDEDSPYSTDNSTSSTESTTTDEGGLTPGFLVPVTFGSMTLIHFWRKKD